MTKNVTLNPLFSDEELLTKPQDGSVTTAKIVDKAVTKAKLADDVKTVKVDNASHADSADSADSAKTATLSELTNAISIGENNYKMTWDGTTLSLVKVN